MSLPRRHWPWLALAGIAGISLTLRGCIAIAHAGDVETVAAGLSSAEAAGGTLVGVASLLLAAWKVGWIGPREAPRPGPTAHTPHFLTREEVERIVTAALQPLTNDMHGQHSRVRGDLKERERAQIATDERLHRLEVGLSDRLARMETTLTSAIREERRT